MDEGHCGLPAEELTPRTGKLLDVSTELVEVGLRLELQAGAIVAMSSVADVACSWLVCTEPSGRLPRNRISDEQRIILEAARTADPLIRWSNWLMGMCGCSTKEVFNARREHFELRDGLVIWHVRGFKTKFRTRSIPLHSSIVGEGFWQYVEILPAGSSLFPMVGGSDADKINGNAGQRINPWIRGSAPTRRCIRGGIASRRGCGAR
jgi:hypothetical protein